MTTAFRWARSALWAIGACAAAGCTDASGSGGGPDAGADADTDADTDTDTDTDADGGADPMSQGEGRDGLAGWMILQDAYDAGNPFDMLAFEWDYFMVHDAEGRFTGSVGYLIANPRDSGEGGAGDLVPKGGNVAFAGKFGSGALSSEYRNWGFDDVFSVSADERVFDAADAADAGTAYYATMTPIAAGAGEPQRLLLEGEMERFAWSLTVSQEWPGLSSGIEAFVPITGTDIGVLSPENEVWTVNMVWPRTRVEGAITDRGAGETYAIDAHGYREDSGGRWAFNTGGWDFATVSDEAASVMWAWQSYHQASTQLDYLDVGFVEDGAVRLVTFRAADGELGWRHDDWTFDPAARQCVPLDTVVVAENLDYRVEAQAALGENQVAILSDLTAATAGFVIMSQFPYVTGTIVRLSDGAQIAAFEGQGGGEFANARQSEGVTSMTDDECDAFGAAFSSPLP
jgi:hypothetical protein